MRRAWKFLLGLGSGEVSLKLKTPVRAEARDIVKHFPLGGNLEEAARRYAPELLEKVESEANELAREAARESARAAGPRTPPDNLNIP
jgi:hypothetical protein